MAEKQEAKSVMLRIPVDLKAWVQDRAERADRSMNWILVKLIEKAKEQEESRQ